ADNMLLIGDAAGQVKPISGGGLQPALRSSYCLSKTVNEAFDSDDLSGKFLSVYEKRWKDEVGKELKNGYRLRKMYTGMSDRDLNKIFGAADNSNVKEVLNGGDIDHPSDLLIPLMKDIATAVRLTPLMLKAVVRSIR
ncbi:MAG: hypothetical protein FWF40_03295, partial [Methanomassiliicoccaceae archaeon]|nr:hypothetical protein [Methanomassiliicoccaceae archaeon]